MRETLPHNSRRTRRRLRWTRQGSRRTLPRRRVGGAVSLLWCVCAASLGLALVLGLVAAPRAFAASTLADYRTRVHDAMIALDSLVAPGEETSASERRGDEAQVVAEVRRRLPPHEQVSWAGGILDVDNGWLHAALDDFQRTAHADEAARARALTHIAERLSALDERLAEAEASATARAVATRDKDAEKGRLAAILRRPEFNQTATKDESALMRLMRQLVEWVRDLFPKRQPIMPAASPTLTSVAQILIYGAGLLLVGFVLWKFAPRFIRERRAAKRRREPRVILGELLRPEQTSADLLAEAEQLARAGNLRGAIRKAYVALLCEFGDRRIIRLAQHKTNRDYLEALRERAALYREMRPLTLDFERHWYGSEAATETDWTNFRTRCRQALQNS